MLHVKPPTSITKTVTAATCASNGAISIVASGGDGVKLEYALYNSANTTSIRGYQDEHEFMGLPAGTYTIRVRYQCDLGYSDDFTEAVTVSGAYSTVSITALNVERNAQCNNGRIKVSHVNGTAPYTYALVPSMTADLLLPTADYVAPPQSSDIFDNLPAGTYYVRIVDACGGFDTKTITINTFTPANPLTTSRVSFRNIPCDTLAFGIVHSLIQNWVDGTNDTIRKLWIDFPNGTTDTLYNVGTKYTHNHYFPAEKLGPIISTDNFPNYVGGTWPKPITINYMDACGNISSRTFNMPKPYYKIQLERIVASSTCSTIAYRARIVDSAYISSFASPAFVLNHNAQISLDGGDTWEIATSSTVPMNEYSNVFYMPMGT